MLYVLDNFQQKKICSFNSHSSQSLMNKMRLISEASVIITTGEAAAAAGSNMHLFFYSSIKLTVNGNSLSCLEKKNYMKDLYVEYEVRKAAVHSEEQAH